MPQFGEAIDAIAPAQMRRFQRNAEKIRHGLTCAGLYDQFAPHIFSATQVSRGKPAPDLFLFAAEQMKVQPARCLVIEDSVPGVTGGRAAGMTVLGFHGGSHCRPGHAEMLRAAGAALTFDDMRHAARSDCAHRSKGWLNSHRIVEVRHRFRLQIKQSCRELTGRQTRR